MRRFTVLDAMRFVAALWVVIGHLVAIPIFGPVGQPDPVLDMAARVWRVMFYGPGAVIAFFVISGFCIHYPFAESNAPCPVGRFYARRYLRILVPVAATVLLFALFIPGTQVRGPNSILWRSTLWSIVCEEIYYAIYPLLNLANRRFGWWPLLAVSTIVSLGLSGWYLKAVNWEDAGIVPTTLILFPVWLLGCLLAQQVGGITRSYAPLQIWLWRLVTWLATTAALLLHSHTPLHQTAMGLWLGIVFYFWIRAELSYYRHRQPWPLFVSGGRWSYSLYLMHPLIIGLAWMQGLEAQAGVLTWLGVMALILVGSYVFYLLIERPSHHLARRIHLFPRHPEALEVPPPDSARGQHA